MDLIVIGSSNLDLIITLPRIPAIGETVLGGESSRVFGGKGANQAVAAARTGGKVAFLTKLGRDIFGHDMRAHFQQEGLPTDWILEDADAPTGIAQIFVSAAGENSIAVAPGANGRLLPADLQPYLPMIAGAQLILVQLEIPMATIAYLAALAEQEGIRLILNPAPAQPLSAAILRNTWLITPNETEASLLSQIPVSDVLSAAKAGEWFLDQGVEQALITLGDKGSVWCTRKGMTHFRAFTEKAVDTTAAGDVFNGALATALTQGKNMEEAIRVASAAAAISVTRPGAQSSIPTAAELQEYLSART